MNCYGIKANGTAEDLKRMEEVFEKVGFGGSFDENGVVNVDEDYAFGIMDQIESAARALISAAPNAEFIFRGYMDDDRSGEIQHFEFVYDKEKLIVKCTDWIDPYDEEGEEEPEDEMEEDDEAGEEEDWAPFDWFGPKYKEESWDYVDEINIAGQTEVKVTAVVINVTEHEDFGSLLMSNLPLEIDAFSDVQADFKGEGKIVISAIRYISDKAEVDNFAEALSVVMPNSKYVVVAEFKDSDTYKYSYDDGKLTCEKKTGEDTYEETEMVRLSDDQKASILEGDDEDEEDE